MKSSIEVMGNRRLLFVVPSAYPLGGVATWLDFLLPGLEEKGWISTLGLVSGKFHDPDRYLSGHPFHQVLRIENPTGSQEGRIRALSEAIKQLDPVMVLSVNIPEVFLAMARLRKNNHSLAKAVMTLHGIQSDLLEDAGKFRYFLDAVVCTNRLTCQLVKEVSEIPGERVLYAPYGIEVPDASVPRKSPESGRPIRIAWVGRLEEQQKRISDLPRILRALEEQHVTFELRVVGAGPDETMLAQELAEWLPVGRVQLLGELSREKVYSEIYSWADVFLLTSSWETGPIVLWEAMSVGLPVVTSEYLGSGPEGSLVHGENCLMYPIGEVSQAARYISMLKDTDLYNSLSAGGVELVTEKYSLEISVSQWNKVLQHSVQADRIEPPELEFPIKARGRLDRWLGVSRAETVRRIFGIHHKHSGPGGEWPHTITGGSQNFSEEEKK